MPRGEYAFIARALDVGAFGRDGSDGRFGGRGAHIVSCTRYPPAGRRGAAFGFAHDDYQGGDLARRSAHLHERTMVIAQIETDEGLANVESIAAVPGVDVLWIGQFDLTNFLGIPGEFAHPRFVAALDRILDACASRGVTPAILAMDDGSARDFARTRLSLMAYGVDHLLLQEAMRSGIERLRAACTPSGKNSTMSAPLRVGITRDILDSRGEPAFGRAALEILDRAPGSRLGIPSAGRRGRRRRPCGDATTRST